MSIPPLAHIADAGAEIDVMARPRVFVDEFSLPRRPAIQGKALEISTQVLLVTLLPRLLGPAEFGRLTLALVTLGWPRK